MNKFLKVIVLSFILFMSNVSDSNAMDPRVKSLGTMAAYGTVCGALLGTASLAFDAPGRSVAIGASLGLYTGILFGSYIVISHHMRRSRSSKGTDYYPDTSSSAYESDGGGESLFGGGGNRREILRLNDLNSNIWNCLLYTSPSPRDV